MPPQAEPAERRGTVAAPRRRDWSNWYPTGDVERQTLTVAEAAKVLGIHRTTAHRMVTAGTLASIKLGGRRLIAKATVDAILAGSEVRRD